MVDKNARVDLANDKIKISENEQKLTRNFESDRVKELKQKDLERETGQSVLMLGNVLHEKVVFIKKQLAFA